MSIETEAILQEEDYEKRIRELNQLVEQYIKDVEKTKYAKFIESENPFDLRDQPHFDIRTIQRYAQEILKVDLSQDPAGRTESDVRKPEIYETAKPGVFYYGYTMGRGKKEIIDKGLAYPCIIVTDPKNSIHELSPESRLLRLMEALKRNQKGEKAVFITG